MVVLRVDLTMYEARVVDNREAQVALSAGELGVIQGFATYSKQMIRRLELRLFWLNC